MALAFEKLVVYQKAVDFLDRICELSETSRRAGFISWRTKSIAALSISTNIAEGTGRFTTPDKRNFFCTECAALFRSASAFWNWFS